MAKTKLTLPELKKVFKHLDAASLCDVRMDLRVMSSEIGPITNSWGMLGRARTVRCRDDFLTVIKALDEAEAGDVLVIDGQGGQKALLGELFCAEAHRKKLSGIIVDGGCRDTQGLAMNLPFFPLYARFKTPMAGTCNQVFETQVAITCGGVEVHPGELIFADRDGILVLNENELDLEFAADSARTIQKKEQSIFGKIRRDEKSLLDLTNARKHIKAIEAGEESKLTFV